jgi:hypothetical protein
MTLSRSVVSVVIRLSTSPVMMRFVEGRAHPDHAVEDGLADIGHHPFAQPRHEPRRKPVRLTCLLRLARSSDIFCAA